RGGGDVPRERVFDIESGLSCPLSTRRVRPWPNPAPPDQTPRRLIRERPIRGPLVFLDFRFPGFAELLLHRRGHRLVVAEVQAVAAAAAGHGLEFGGIVG